MADNTDMMNYDHRASKLARNLDRPCFRPVETIDSTDGDERVAAAEPTPTPTLHRSIDGGLAQFGAGCELEDFALGSSTQLTSKVIVQTSASTVLIFGWPNLESPPAVLKQYLVEEGGPIQFFRPANDKQQFRWTGVTTVVGFRESADALKAVAWANTADNGPSGSEILYTVCYIASSKIFDTIVRPGGVLEPLEPELHLE
jgi:hypothetical protein